MLASHIRDAKKRIEIISNIPRPQHALPQGTDNSMPHARPWREMQDGSLMRLVYCPGEWKKLPVETVAVFTGWDATPQEEAMG
jgi:hypothetical protein